MSDHLHDDANDAAIAAEREARQWREKYETESRENGALRVIVLVLFGGVFLSLHGFLSTLETKDEINSRVDAVQAQADTATQFNRSCADRIVAAEAEGSLRGLSYGRVIRDEQQRTIESCKAFFDLVRGTYLGKP
jgi:hypothetical protein